MFVPRSGTNILKMDKLDFVQYSNNSTDTQDNNKHFQAIYNALHYVQKNYHKNLVFEEISQIANLSPFYFHKLFHQYIGVSPHVYLIQTRIKKAGALLLKGLTISETAIKTGFTDQSHFSKFFKKVIGITSGQYIKFRKINSISGYTDGIFILRKRVTVTKLLADVYLTF